MTTPTIATAAVLLERAVEQLRQERDTFELRKAQEVRWFQLKLVMGYAAVALVIAVMFIAGYVLLGPRMFSPTVVNMAATALLVDVLGLFAAVWKIVLNPSSGTRLAPVTNHHEPVVAAATPESESTKKNGRTARGLRKERR